MVLLSGAEGLCKGRRTGVQDWEQRPDICGKNIVQLMKGGSGSLFQNHTTTLWDVEERIE